MSRLHLYLPPVAPDYSGVCSLLYDLGGIAVLHDASGCSGNTIGYDEPRWIDRPNHTYCSGLRHLDAVLGLDNKLIDRCVDACRVHHPEFMAIVGTPVPMLIGTDYDGIAREIEYETGVPCFGFDTKGLDFYDTGVAMAAEAFLSRFCEKRPVRKGSINIVGMTPIDFGMDSNELLIEDLFTNAGIPVVANIGMNWNMETLKKVSEAQLNLAVSLSGLKIAKTMKKLFGTPYVVGTPTGDGRLVLERVQAALDGRQIQNTEKRSSGGRRVLIIGEQVQSTSLRDEIERTGDADVTVAVLCNCDSSLLRKGDYEFVNESSILSLLSSGEFTDLIADPLIGQLAEDENIRFYPRAHVALSSSCFPKELFPVMGQRMVKLIQEVGC